jgi:hypothetical protein
LRKILTALSLSLLLVLSIALPTAAAPVPCATWVTTTLPDYVTPSVDGDVLHMTDGGSNVYNQPVSEFCLIFGAAIEDETQPDKYVALSSPVVHTFVWTNGYTYSGTADDLGYQMYFDYWHGLGLF